MNETAHQARSPYRIVAATFEHLHAIAAIERAAAELFAAEDLSPEAAAESTPIAVLAEAQAEGRLWVALSSGRPVGFALAGVVDGRGHLEELDVDPDYGRRGLGTQLLDRALCWQRSCELPGMTLTTFDHVAWNRPFYERRGFVRLAAPEPGSELERILAAEKRRGLKQRIAMIHRGDAG